MLRSQRGHHRSAPRPTGRRLRRRKAHPGESRRPDRQRLPGVAHPTDGLRRTPNGQSVDPADDRSRESAAPVEGAAKTLVSRSREIAAPTRRRMPSRRIAAAKAAPVRPPLCLKKKTKKIPPNPPAQRGGPTLRPPTTPTTSVPDERVPIPAPSVPTPEPKPTAPKSPANAKLPNGAAPNCRRGRYPPSPRGGSPRRRHRIRSRSDRALRRSQRRGLGRRRRPRNRWSRGAAGPLTLRRRRRLVGWCRGAASRHPGLLAAAVSRPRQPVAPHTGRGRDRRTIPAATAPDGHSVVTGPARPAGPPVTDRGGAGVNVMDVSLTTSFPMTRARPRFSGGAVSGSCGESGRLADGWRAAAVIVAGMGADPDELRWSGRRFCRPVAMMAVLVVLALATLPVLVDEAKVGDVEVGADGVEPSAPPELPAAVAATPPVPPTVDVVVSATSDPTFTTAARRPRPTSRSCRRPRR